MTKKKKDFRINARLNGDQWSWFLSRAGLGRGNFSKYIQNIPDIIRGMEDELDALRSENIALKKQINEGHGYSINDFL